MSEYRFSIIVPVYNVEKYLEACIQSLANQEYSDYEVLLVDDGSTDASGIICDRFAEQYPKVKVVHRQNQGVAAARNEGLEQAKGEYILFVDSDDYVDSDMCRRLDRILMDAHNPETAVYGGTEENGECEKHLESPVKLNGKMFSGKEYLLCCYRENCLYNTVWMYAYKRSYLERYHLRFVEGILHEDVEFIMRSLLNVNVMIKAEVFPYHYRVRPGSISTQERKEKNVRDLFWVLREQEKLAETQEPELRRWMKNALLNSYLSMILEVKIYRPEYRKYYSREFLFGKAITRRNLFRVILCACSPRLYCEINELYKRARG